MPISFNPFVPSQRTGGPVFNPSIPFSQSSAGGACAPVTILDIHGNTIAIVQSGGSYTVNLNYFDLTFIYPAGGFLYDANIQQFEGVLSLDTLPANVTSFNLKIVRLGITTLYTQANMPLLITVDKEDVIALEVAPTSMLSPVTFTMRIDYDADSTVKVSPVDGDSEYGWNVDAFDQTVSIWPVSTNIVTHTVALPGAHAYKPGAYSVPDKCLYVFGNAFAARIDMDPANIGTTFGTIVHSGVLGLINVVSAEYDQALDRIFLGRAQDMDVFTPSTFMSAAANTWLGTVTRTNARMTFIRPLRALVVGDDTGVALIDMDHQFVRTQYGFPVGQLRAFGGIIYGTGVNQALKRRMAPDLLKSITSSISTGSNLGGVAFVPSLNRAYFSHRTTKSIGVMNMTTGTMLGNITWAGIANGCRDIKYCPANGMIYAQASSASGLAGCNQIYIIDPNSGAFGAQIGAVTVGNMESSSHIYANSFGFTGLNQ